jgi:hypothetical protein
MDKKDFWPKKGKLKKGLIVLLIVVVGTLGITLLEEKTSVKFTKRMPIVIAFACIGVWLYQPSKNKE